MELIPVKGTLHQSWTKENLISASECDEFIEMIERRSSGEFHQETISSSGLATRIWDRLEKISDLHTTLDSAAPGYRLEGFSDLVVLAKTKEPIGIHKDTDIPMPPPLKCLHKALIYLNDLSDPVDPTDLQGGTSFYNENRELLITVKPGRGKLLIFDMKEWHSGNPAQQKVDTKYTLGLRLVYRPD